MSPYSREEEIKGLIVCVGGGATIKNPKVECNNTKIELHFHINVETPKMIEQIKGAIICALKGVKENENRETLPDLSTLLDGDKRATMVD